MILRLRRFFEIRPGEARPLAWCALYVALAVATFLLAKPIKDGLFLQQFGAYKLVYAFVGVPIVLSMFVPLYGAIAVRVGQRAVITGSMLFFCANVLWFWWAFTHEPAPLLSAAFWVATLWNLAEQTLVAAAFLVPPGSRPGRLRDPLLLLFCFATYAVAPVPSFGWLLLAMGVSQCRDSLPIRLWYLAAFATLAFYYEVPWATLLVAFWGRRSRTVRP